MNRPAIDDLLDGILSRWFETIAEWMPPGQAMSGTCHSCQTSLIADSIDVVEWPHELVHHLASNLEALAIQAFDSLTFRGTRENVRDYISARVRAQADDMRDMLAECVEPRVEAWARAEVARGMTAADLQF